jgi:hypothetical protein
LNEWNEEFIGGLNCEEKAEGGRLVLLWGLSLREKELKWFGVIENEKGAMKNNEGSLIVRLKLHSSRI